MNKLRKINLELDAISLGDVSGEGNELAFRFVAERKTKAGTPERYTVRLKVCRYTVTELLQQIAKMHARDRLRILEETRRIDRETNILKVLP